MNRSLSARTWDGLAIGALSIAVVLCTAWVIDGARDLGAPVLYGAIGMFCHLKARLREIEDGHDGR